MSNNIIVQAKAVSIFYKDKKIIDNLNANFEENKIHTIIGPSGAGKSSFLRTLNLMNKEEEGFSFSGEIFFRQKNILDYSLYELRQKLGMVHQMPIVFPNTIFHNVIFGVKYLSLVSKGKWEDIVIKSLKSVNLYEEVKDRLQSNALDLSQGQKQRLCIARVLATNPEVLLLDEPTASLDEKATLSIEKLLLELKSCCSCPIILVTHDLEQVKRISDKSLEIQPFN